MSEATRNLTKTVETKDSTHYLSHVEGTRALAVLLVVGYHLFTEQTAGAVDIFFVLTGFLVVSSLLRRYERGYEGVREFLRGLFLRLAPVSLVVLIGVYVGSLVFLPPVGINEVHREIIASALYVENWQLILQNSDYLSRGTPPSPVLHFWAMSAQMQFYLLTAFIIAIGIWVGSRFGGGGTPYRGFAVTFGVVFIASLAYSIYLTYFVSAEWAYFDTLTRYWEFLIGAILAIALALKPHLQIAWQWGWVGILGILSAGALVAPLAPFPGFAALVPTLSTVIIILAGKHSNRASVSTLLGWAPMVSLGGVAYTLYLVHWPLLIFYRSVDDQSITWRSGLAIFAISIALAYLLRFTVEKPLLRIKYGNRSGLVLAATSVPLAILAIGGPAISILNNSTQVTAGSFLGTIQTLGGGALDKDEWYNVTVNPAEIVPSFETVRDSRPPMHFDKSHLGKTCHVDRSARREVAWCEYGESTNPSHTVALVGASHSAQWLPPLEVVAKANGWRIVSLTAADCNFLIPHPTRHPYQGCDSVEQAMEHGILELRPDLVITIANTGSSSEPELERIVPWLVLDEANIPVVAIRDNPYFEEQPSRCVAQNIDNPVACAVERDSVLAPNFSLGKAPGNVTLVDMTDQYCDDYLCPAIIGNTLLWRDADHFTVEFALTMAEVLEERILDVWSPPPASSVDESALRELIPPRPGS